jgi:hypothetical protein
LTFKVVINKIINSLYLEMASRLKQFILIGVFVELILFVYFFYFNDAVEDAFRLSARYTGRLSFGLYLLMFFHFIYERSKGKVLQNTYLWGMVFCVLHIIHFAYLSAAVYLNDLPIVPHKIAGGFLAYLAIVIYPFYMMKIKRLGIHLIYFYYVGFVMAMTFFARIRGEFEGAPQSPFHYFGIVLIISFFMYCPYTLFKAKKV